MPKGQQSSTTVAWESQPRPNLRALSAWVSWRSDLLLRQYQVEPILPPFPPASWTLGRLAPQPVPATLRVAPSLEILTLAAPRPPWGRCGLQGFPLVLVF